MLKTNKTYVTKRLATKNAKNGPCFKTVVPNLLCFMPPLKISKYFVVPPIN